MLKHKWVLLTWHDSAFGPARWTDLKDAVEQAGIAECNTAGYVIKATKRQVILAQNRDPENDNVDACMAIPTKVISEFKIIE